MENFAIGVGVLLAVFGPLLLIPVIWLIYRMVARLIVVSVLVPRVSHRNAHRIALILTLLVVAGSLSLSYFPGRWEFDRLCSEKGTPMVSKRIRVDSHYRPRLYPYEARRFLGDDTFVFLEAPHLHRRGMFVRYSRAKGGDIHEEEVQAVKSSYGVRESLSRRSYGIVMTEKSVYEINSNRELARAAHIVYEGGPLALFLGVYAMSSCPDIRSAEGSEHFTTFYDLETIVLRAPGEGQQDKDHER